MKQIEQIQYEAARVLTGAWKGTSREKLYKILGWESLNERRIMRKVSTIYETIQTKKPTYLYKIIEKQIYDESYRELTMGTNLLKPINCSKPCYKLSFIPSAIKDWNNLDDEIRDSRSKNIFKKRILNKIRPKKASYFGKRNHDHVRYLTMLRVGLSPLRSHKFNHGFLDTPNGLCTLCNQKEDTNHYLLSCRSYILSRATLMQKISEILGYDVSTLPKRTLVNLLLYGREDITVSKNYLILNNVIEYIIQSKRLDIFGEVEGGI